MRFLLVRQPETADFIDGDLYTYSAEEKNHLGFTLENPTHRNPEDKRPLGIPAGLYAVEARYSEHFKKFVPWILGVPGREAIEIHGGNHVEDSLGCVLVGLARVQPGVIAQHETDHITDLVRNARSAVEIEVIDAGSLEEKKSEAVESAYIENAVFTIADDQVLCNGEVFFTKKQCEELDVKYKRTLSNEDLIEIATENNEQKKPS